MATIKTLADDLVVDIQKDCDKITKAFNKAVADEFYTQAKIFAREWYETNKPQSNTYKRTKQLSQNAILYKKFSEFEYHVSFEADFIQRKPRNRSKPASYESSIGEDVATSILQYEEEMLGTFSHYKTNIWERTLLQMINSSIDWISFNVPKLSLPDEIKNDLIKKLREETKKYLKDEYKKQYG